MWNIHTLSTMTLLYVYVYDTSKNKVWLIWAVGKRSSVASCRVKKAYVARTFCLSMALDTVQYSPQQIRLRSDEIEYNWLRNKPCILAVLENLECGSYFYHSFSNYRAKIGNVGLVFKDPCKIDRLQPFSNSKLNFFFSLIYNADFFHPRIRENAGEF